MKILYTAMLTLLLFSTLNQMSAQAWKPYYPPFPDTISISDIEVVNENIIWAIGARSGVTDSTYSSGVGTVAYYAVTADGGATWKTGTIPMGSAPFLANIAATDAGAALVIGLNNFSEAKTLKTIDGGTTWQVSPNNWDPVLSWPDYIHAFSPARSTVIGDPREGEFEIYTTGNAGISWMKTPGENIPDPLSGEFSFNNAGAVVDNTMWFGTSVGRVYRSLDAGATWTSAQTPLAAVGALSFADADYGVGGYLFAYGSHSQLITTGDGGTTWTELNNLPHDGDFSTFGLVYIPEQPYILLSLSTGGNLTGSFETWVSPDRGIIWHQISNGEIIVWPTFLNASIGWAGENQQLSHETRLYKYIGNPLDGLFSPNTLPAEITLFPNPVSDLLRVHVQVPEPGDFILLLNDAQGSLVSNRTVRNAADFTEEMTLSGLPAGIYTLIVTGKAGSITRQLSKL